jgi:hypothetical protein
MTQPGTRSRPRRWLSRTLAIVVIVGSMLIPTATATAAEPTDMVLEWNLNAVNVILGLPAATPPGLGHNPPLAGVDLAIVQAAVYDAVNSIDGGHEPFLGRINAPAGASEAAAVATAAHHVLGGLLASTPAGVTANLDSLYATSLAKIPDGQAKTDGITVGVAAAAAMLANRAGDGRTGTRTFVVGTQPGEWRPVPPLNLNVFSFAGDIRPFALKRSDQLRVEGPPDLGSAQYAREFNEVKRLGAQTGDRRTDAQDALANFIVGNPFPMVNKAFREIAVARGLSTAQQARLFGMSSVASGDAFISCWNNKNRYSFWRPQTAIQLAATDGNPATTADPNWMSLFPTPGYPDMPSGYNCYTAAMMASARAFFHTDFVSFDLTSGTLTRHYHRFSGFIRDSIDGRILTGFHFRSADVQGAWVGKKAAQWVAKRFFEPVDN